MAANTLKDLYKYDSSYMDHQDVELYKILYDAKFSSMKFSFDSDSDLLENIKSFMFINFSLSFKDETITSNPDIFVPLFLTIKEFDPRIFIDGESLNKLIKFSINNDSFFLRRAELSRLRTIGTYVYFLASRNATVSAYIAHEFLIPGIYYRERNFNVWLENPVVFPEFDMYCNVTIYNKALVKKIPDGTVYVICNKIDKDTIIPDSVKYLECYNISKVHLNQNITHLHIPSDKIDGNRLPKSLVYLSVREIRGEADLKHLRYLRISDRFWDYELPNLEYYKGHGKDLSSNKKLKHVTLINDDQEAIFPEIISLNLLIKNFTGLSLPSSLRNLQLEGVSFLELNEGLEILKLNRTDLTFKYIDDKLIIEYNSKEIPKSVKLCFVNQMTFLL